MTTSIKPIQGLKALMSARVQRHHILVAGYLVWMRLHNLFTINEPTRQLHRHSSIAGLSFLGRAEEGQHIVCLGLKVLSERCIARQPTGHHPPRPRTQSQSLAGPVVASQFHFLWEWKATGSQDLLYALQYVVPWHDSSNALYEMAA